MKRDYRLYIDDMIESINNIEEYITGITREDFAKDKKTIDAVVRNLEVLGEAARHIPDNLRKKFPDIPWREIAGMRNKLIHEYFGIDIETLEKTVYESLPKLKAPLLKTLRELNEDNDN